MFRMRAVSGRDCCVRFHLCYHADITPGGIRDAWNNKRVMIMARNGIYILHLTGMKQNTFYILAGLVGLAEVGLFLLSVELRNPLIIMIGFIMGVGLLYITRMTITDLKEDERSVLITQKAGFRTLEVFWVIFFAMSLGGAVIGFSTPLGLPRPRGMPPDFPRDEPHLGYFGIFQMILLCCIAFLYFGFRVYYARKYGEWDSDEE